VAAVGPARRRALQVTSCHLIEPRKRGTQAPLPGGLRPRRHPDALHGHAPARAMASKTISTGTWPSIRYNAGHQIPPFDRRAVEASGAGDSLMARAPAARQPRAEPRHRHHAGVTP